MIIYLLIQFFLYWVSRGKKMISSYVPNDEEIAKILEAQGFQPEKNESDEEFRGRVNRFVQENKNLKNSDIEYFIKNKDKIHGILKQRLKVKYVLVNSGHVIKWAKTTYSAITVSASKIGAEGLKAGWGQLVNITAQVGIKQLTKNTLIRTLTSSTTWIIAGVVCAIEIGYDFYQLCKGSITLKQFFLNASKSIVGGVASVAGGAGGAALGAAIGACAGPVGAIIGIIIGGIVGGVTATLTANYAIDKIDQACFQYNNPKKIYQKALNFFELPENFKPSQLQAARKAKYSLYHPDIWKDSSEETKKQKASNLMATLQYYEIIVNYQPEQNK